MSTNQELTSFQEHVFYDARYASGTRRLRVSLITDGCRQLGTMRVTREFYITGGGFLRIFA